LSEASPRGIVESPSPEFQLGGVTSLPTFEDVDMRRETMKVLLPMILLGTCMMNGLHETAAAAADPLADRFEKKVYKAASGLALPYRYLRPAKIEAGKKYPVVIFLHGAGERGTENETPLVHGVKKFATDEFLTKYPCFVIVPQCPTKSKWVEVDWTLDRHQMPDAPSVPMQATLDLLDELLKKEPIDPTRQYVSGLSMGGYGTWDLIQRFPERFAAAVPVCGGGDEKQAKKIAKVPVWAFHGAKDTAVKPERSRRMIAAMKEAGGAPKYTEYPDVGHNSWVPAYNDLKLYEWLFSQKTAVAVKE